MSRKVQTLITVLAVALTLTLASASEAEASSYCPHHDYYRHGKTVYYDYIRQRNGTEWHQHFYNRWAWNGARYVFTYSVKRYCFRVDMARENQIGEYA